MPYSSEFQPWRVIVHEQGGAYSTQNACHETLTTPDVSANKGMTLHIFRDAGTICLDKDPTTGNTLIASVIAPFARVVIKGGVGLVDGSIVARSLGSQYAGGQNGEDVQLHGNTYEGPMQCSCCD